MSVDHSKQMNQRCRKSCSCSLINQDNNQNLVFAAKTFSQKHENKRGGDQLTAAVRNTLADSLKLVIFFILCEALRRRR